MIFWVLVHLPVQAQWIQQGQDIDGEAAGDLSGSSVDLNADGSVIAIGAPENNGNGSDAGHVRVFELNSSTWVQRGQDIDGEAADDRSGFSVSLSSDGSIVAIGAHQNDGNGNNAGHVRVYAYDVGNWTQRGQDIDGQATGNLSGFSTELSADGLTVAIGSPGIGVRVFAFDGISWIQQGQHIDAETVGDGSGFSVSLSADGSIVAIGAPENDENGNNAGNARVFEFNGVDWIQQGQDIDGDAVLDLSGWSVSLSADGSAVAIGARGNDGNASFVGYVRMFEFNGTNWVQQGQDIDGEAIGDESGWSVSLSADGSTVAIGARFNGANNSGHVRVHTLTGVGWVPQGQDIDGEATADFSGFSVSLSADGSTVAIGALQNDGNGVDAGHVRVYTSGSVTVPENTFENTIDLYPNPVTDRLILEFGEERVQHINIVNSLGKEVVHLNTIHSSRQEISLVGLTPGIYFVHVFNSDQDRIIKLVKL